MISEISCLDLIRKLEKNEKLLVVDTREASSYYAGHIRRAIHMKPRELRSLAPQYFPNRGSAILLYGTSENLADTRLAASTLQELGYYNLYVCGHGFESWKEGGLWTESSPLSFGLNFL